MGFIVKNESFVCSFCGEKNPPAFRTCRNHCRKCLHSFHVDLDFPGDRKAECAGEMEVVEIVPDSKYGFILTHQCKKCGKKIKNRAADDDNRDEIFSFFQKKAENFTHKKCIL